MSMPNGVSKIERLDTKCPNCQKRMKKDVNLFKIGFRKDSIINPEMRDLLDIEIENELYGHFCVVSGCDSKFSSLIDTSKNMKRTYAEAFPAQPAY